MLKYCLNKWYQNKHLLERRLVTDTKWNCCSYIDLVELVVYCILNGEQTLHGYGSESVWDYRRITIIDNGDYQGTQLFLIPRDTYQPCEYDYLMTYVGYGSCGGCDTLQAIQEWGEKPLTETQVKDFMALCKDILTNMIKPYNDGWRSEEGFQEVTVEI